jgi:translation initiation factor 1 (eIF-1/SUI1)
MGIFSAILDKLRNHGRTSQPQQPTGQPQQQQYQPTSSPTQQPGAAIQPMQDVDVDKVLKEMAAKHGGGGNYRESIVDLLKLLDLDSSLDARKELAKELNVNAGAPGTAEQNIALHKAVMRKIAENGGKVPDSMKD